MRHVEEVIRKIEELKQIIHNSNSIYGQSYSEQCEIGKKGAFLEVLQYVINNGILTESKILELKLQVENEIKEKKIKKKNKKINELEIKIIDNKCILNSLTEG